MPLLLELRRVLVPRRLASSRWTRSASFCRSVGSSPFSGVLPTRTGGSPQCGLFSRPRPASSALMTCRRYNAAHSASAANEHPTAEQSDAVAHAVDAMVAGDTQRCLDLIAAGADPTKMLVRAILFNSVETGWVQWLLDKGADPNLPQNGESALPLVASWSTHRMSKEGLDLRLSKLDVLTSRGVDWNCRDEKGETALEKLVWAAVAQEKRQSNRRKTWCIVLIWKFLQARGGDPHLKNPSGRSALDMAKEASPRLANALEESG